MKKILILETAISYHGLKRGGSYIQARFYNNLLNKNGYISKVYIDHSNKNNLIKVLRIISEIRKSDYVIGFGTPLLNIYLQWLCFIFGKIGIFCTDTIIVTLKSINDHLKRKSFNIRFLTSVIIQYIINALAIKIPPPRLNLINISSCQYVKDKLIKTVIYPKENNFLYPTVEIKRRNKKKNATNKKVLFYGALYRGRGVIDLLNACRLLWQKEYQFKLMILGWPVERLTKKTLINEIKDKEKEKIVIKEKEEDILKIVEDATVVVLPFRYPCSFQTPYTLLEPMGLGVPVITTDVGSHTEWVKDDETGLICDKENPQDIADKIEAVFKNKKLVDRITNGAFSLLTKRHKEKDILLETLKKLEDEK
jgi:glycosyltransferase involved in cell wall biosynthesis